MTTRLNPHGFGVAVADRYYVPILEDNQPYPTSEKSIRMPVSSSSSSWRFSVVRKVCVSGPKGTHTSRAEYDLVGKVELTSFPNGTEEVEVGMRYTDSCVLEVRFAYPGTGTGQTIRFHCPDTPTVTPVRLEEVPADAEAIKALMAKPADLPDHDQSP
jgi:hypothetical protein